VTAGTSGLTGVHLPTAAGAPQRRGATALAAQISKIDAQQAAQIRSLEEIPYLGEILPSLPPALKARLFAVTDLAIVWSKDKGHATVTAVITDETLAALPAILNPAQSGYHDTANPADPEPCGHQGQLPAGPRSPRAARPPGRGWQKPEKPRLSCHRSQGRP
jgi:hypothetical protein